MSTTQVDYDTQIKNRPFTALVANGGGVVNVAASIQASLSAGITDVYLGADNNGGTTYNLGTTGLVLDAAAGGPSRFVMPAGVKFIYSGSGAAITIKNYGNSFDEGYEFHVAVKRATEQWDGGGDTTSIGVLIQDCDWCKFHIRFVNFFHEAVRLQAVTTDVIDNTIYLGLLEDNMLGYTHMPGGGFGVNSNVIIGGSVLINSNHTVRRAGTRYVLLRSGSDNQNLFMGQDLENNMPEQTLEVQAGAALNYFLGQRYEDSFSILLAGNYNTIEAGLFDGNYAIVTDTGGGNRLDGPFQLRMDNFGSSTPLMRFIDSSSPGRPDILSFRGDTRSLVVGDGTVGSVALNKLTTTVSAFILMDALLRNTSSGGFSIGSDGGHLRIDSAGATGYEFRIFNAANALTGVQVSAVSVGGAKITSGSGSPNGVVTGSMGDLYMNLSGGTNTSLYVKESGSATNTGWVGK